MTEYVALVVVVLGIMIYLLHLAFSLSDNYDPLKMLLIGVSMVIGTLLINLGKNISVDQGASTAIQNTFDTLYYVWITIIGIFLIYIVLYLVIRGWNAIQEKKKIRFDDAENS